MKKEKKVTTVEELKEKFASSAAVFLTHYRGLTVKQMNELRRAIDAAGSGYRVSKNTLARLAATGTDFEVLNEDMVGPIGAVFVQDDPAAAAKALVEFAKANDKLEIISGALGGQKLAVSDIEALSKLPSREELLGQLLSVMVGPMRNLVGVFAAVPRSMVQVLAAIEEEKKKAA